MPIKAYPVAAVNDAGLFKRTSDKTFDNDSLESFYKPIDSYEGIHRYDPDFEWDAKEEKRVVRKVCLITHIRGSVIPLIQTIDRLSDMLVGVLDVFCFAAGQRQHQSSS